MKERNENQDPSRQAAAQTPLESAAHDTGRGLETTPDHDSTHAKRLERIVVEERRLKEWAEKKRKLRTKLPPEDARGSEHTVHYDEKSGRYIKATRPDSHLGYGISFGSYSQGASPSKYLDRLVIHNRIFGDDVQLEYIVPVGDKLSIVTSQPAIKGRDAKQTEIDVMMDEKGFERIGPGTYYHAGEGLLVHDLVPKNAKHAEMDGLIYPIDPVIQRTTTDFAEFLRKRLIHIERR